MPPIPPGASRSEISRQEFYNQLKNEISPEKFAGEGFYATEEYAKPSDITDPWVRADTEQLGEYYPTPRRRR